MTSSPPSSPPPAAHESPISLDEDVPEQQNVREGPTSLAARFQSLCRASPPPETASASDPRPPASRPRILPRPIARLNAPLLGRPRGTAVRSCDQCRTSKQKCDRNQPCATCIMRKLKCTWSQAGLAPPGPLAQQVMENRAEIARLRHEANTLARILRLTPVDFELFHREAQRLADGGRGHPVKLPPFRGMKRARAFDIHQLDRVDLPNKAPRRHEERSLPRARSPRSPPRPPHRSPIRRPDQASGTPSRSNLPFAPHYRPVVCHPGESPRAAYRETAVQTSPRSAPAMNAPLVHHPRPLPPTRTSFSTLPPLLIPSPVVVSRPSPALPPRLAHLAAPASSSTTSPRHRRPHYVLPTPIYSSTPTSASFFPLSAASTSTGSKFSNHPSGSWPVFSPYESKSISSSLSPRVQPYTPLSAVRDEKPKLPPTRPRRAREEEEEEDGDNDDIIIVKFERNPSPPIPPQNVEAKESSPRTTTESTKTVTPSLRNLLND